MFIKPNSNKVPLCLPAITLMTMVLYFSAEWYRYSSGMQVMERELMDQAKRNNETVDGYVDYINSALFMYPSRKEHYDTVIPLCEKLRNLGYAKHVPISEQLNTIIHALEVHVMYPEDKKKLNVSLNPLVHFENTENQFEYYRSVILKKYYMHFLEKTSSSMGCCFGSMTSVQYYDPLQEKYAVYFGRYFCGNSENVQINGKMTAGVKLNYIPIKPRIHSFQVVIPSFRYYGDGILFDTSYYHIKVVDKEGV